MKFLLAALGFFLIGVAANSEDQPSDITLEPYGRFFEEWNLVTARYRKDNGEFRLVYANPAAWKALKAGQKPYPDGAVFIKIAYHLDEDPLFRASLVPMATKSLRYQLMIHNQAKYAETDGWGYALFNYARKRVTDYPNNGYQQTSMACAACHRVAQERAFVFSQRLDPLAALDLPATGAGGKSVASGLTFETVIIGGLPSELKKRIPNGITRVRSLLGAMKQHSFTGTWNEIRPVLVHEAALSGMPAVLVSEDKENFAAAFTDPAVPDCAKEVLRSIDSPTPAVAAPACLHVLQYP